MDEIRDLMDSWVYDNPQLTVQHFASMSVAELQQACGLWQVEASDGGWRMLEQRDNDALNTAAKDGVAKVELAARTSGRSGWRVVDLDAGTQQRLSTGRVRKLRRFPDLKDHGHRISAVRDMQDPATLGRSVLEGAADWTRQLPDVPKNPLQTYMLATCSDMRDSRGKSAGWQYVKSKGSMYGLGLLGVAPFLLIPIVAGPETGRGAGLVTCLLLSQNDSTVDGENITRTLEVPCADVDLKDFTLWTCTAWFVLAYMMFTFPGKCHDIAGVWVAFFSRCQRHRCGQAASGMCLSLATASGRTAGIWIGSGCTCSSRRCSASHASGRRSGATSRSTARPAA